MRTRQQSRVALLRAARHPALLPALQRRHSPVIEASSWPASSGSPRPPRPRRPCRRGQTLPRAPRCEQTHAPCQSPCLLASTRPLRHSQTGSGAAARQALARSMARGYRLTGAARRTPRRHCRRKRRPRRAAPPPTRRCPPSRQTQRSVPCHLCRACRGRRRRRRQRTPPRTLPPRPATQAPLLWWTSGRWGSARRAETPRASRRRSRCSAAPCRWSGG
mmetsp:Transcript_40883/g.122064  ORF Transcript_40883/g.122064 Transcript_40883/m.122064 type:complete len:219 (-) Transcript_40883:56-712(-)